jgi:hypothetical protein
MLYIKAFVIKKHDVPQQIPNLAGIFPCRMQLIIGRKQHMTNIIVYLAYIFKIP